VVDFAHRGARLEAGANVFKETDAMAILNPKESQGYIYFDQEECLTAGASLANSYQNAQPFPHIALADFLPLDFLRGLLDEFPDSAGKEHFDRAQERLKVQFQPQDIPGRRLRNLVTELNSAPVLRFLEVMTGIKGLIPDPYYVGGGLHETKSGGHLSVHADFNLHRGMNLERRLNLLVYLNDGWPAEYGGDLELWDKQMQKCCRRIPPLLGHAVVFNTSKDSFHGQPDPVRCPPDRARRSIATYYYTSSDAGVSTERTTVFRTRPGSQDKPDLRIKLDHLMRDWVPPRLYPYAARLNPFK
jgi:Rps23 Pro-64 3,4-dihydroxylase Tpa1-like proline 4-hydroxylase